MNISYSNKTKITFFLVIITLMISSCAGVSPRDVLKIPKEQNKETSVTEIPGKNDVLVNSELFKRPVDDVWRAANESIYWIKWKPFIDDRDNNIIVLKEAYVYENEGSIKRIYNWPPMNELARSDLSDYIRKVASTDNDGVKNHTVFTQENMKIKFKSSGADETRVTISYEVIPHLKNGDIGDVLTSSNYIETIVLNKIKEYLSKTGASGTNGGLSSME